MILVPHGTYIYCYQVMTYFSANRLYNLPDILSSNTITCYMKTIFSPKFILLPFENQTYF